MKGKDVFRLVQKQDILSIDLVKNILIFMIYSSKSMIPTLISPKK